MCTSTEKENELSYMGPCSLQGDQSLLAIEAVMPCVLNIPGIVACQVLDIVWLLVFHRDFSSPSHFQTQILAQDPFSNKVYLQP